ncbi:MAG: hypothetical protein IJZ82_09730, partial [Lachnospiraceae bacterium]|nr:hypothetical protein [Lachnospiraceae bacterium]
MMEGNMSDFEKNEIDEVLEEKVDTTSEETEENDNDYEDVCFVCRRPESKAGRMFKLPNNICICDDCMHKTMDTVSQYDYQELMSNPQLQKELDDLMKGGGNMPGGNPGGIPGMPQIRFVNMSDFQGMGGIPQKQKLKKK